MNGINYKSCPAIRFNKTYFIWINKQLDAVFNYVNTNVLTLERHRNVKITLTYVAIVFFLQSELSYFIKKSAPRAKGLYTLQSKLFHVQSKLSNGVAGWLVYLFYRFLPLFDGVPFLNCGVY